MATGGPEIGVIGLRETIRTLEQLGVEVSDLKEAMHRVGNIVVDEAKQNVNSVSGRLAGSIRSSKAKGGVTIRAGGARVPYAGVNHFGWPSRNYAANQFIYDASEAKQQQVVQTLSDEINEIMRQIGLI